MSPIRIQPANGGAVFHPNHDALHGFTVVLEAGEWTYAGRWDHQRPDGHIVLKGGRRHRDGDESIDTRTFIERTATYGLMPEEDHMLVPAEGVTRVRRLGDLQRELRGF